MPDVIRAFGGSVERERGRDQGIDVVKGARARRPQEGFELREGLFDRIEVRAIRRKESEEPAARLNRRAHVGLFVDRQVVEHHHVAGPERRRQDLLDVGQKAGVVEGTVKDRRRGQPLEAQTGDDGVALPMAEGRVIAEALAARTPAIAAEQIRRHPAFIEEDVLADVTERLPVAPARAGHDDIRPTLFVGVYGFF